MEVSITHSDKSCQQWEATQTMGYTWLGQSPPGTLPYQGAQVAGSSLKPKRTSWCCWTCGSFSTTAAGAGKQPSGLMMEPKEGLQ